MLLLIALVLPTTPAKAEVAPPSAATLETQLTDLVNADRAAQGLPALRVDVRLVRTARGWSGAQAASGVMQHDDGIRSSLPPGTRQWGENVGRTGLSADAAAVLHAAFMGSPGHRETLLDPAYTAIGIGIQESGGTVWATERLTAGALPALNPAAIFIANDARGTFGASGGAEHAVIVRDDDFPDALAASALAGDGGPILFTPHGPALLPAARAALDQILPKSHIVYVIGGSDAVDPAVDEELKSAGWNVVRVAGEDRYTTAAAVARTVAERDGDPSTILLATGANWPDAAAGAAFASRGDAVILLADRNEVPEVTWSVLREVDEERVFALGGTAVLSDHVVEVTGAHRVAGNSREETAVAIAEELWEKHDASAAPRWTVVAANEPFGWTWALGAAPWAAFSDAPMLLVAEPVGERIVSYLDSLGYGEIVGEALARGPVADSSRQTLEEHLH